MEKQVILVFFVEPIPDNQGSGLWRRVRRGSADGSLQIDQKGPDLSGPAVSLGRNVGASWGRLGW